MRRLYTFVVRILYEGKEPPILSGHVREPASTDDWHVAFGNLSELLEHLSLRVERAPPPPSAFPSDAAEFRPNEPDA